MFSAEPEPDVFARFEEDDVWTSLLEEEPSKEGKKLFSWEGFTNKTHKEPSSAYIAEAGPDAFDATLASRTHKSGHRGNAGFALQSNALLRSLVYLGLGRSSTFFTYDERSYGFKQVVDDCRIPGHSRESSQTLIKSLRNCGNRFVELRDFGNGVYKEEASFPALIALAHSVSTILSAIENHITERIGEIWSFLQMQRVFDKPFQVLEHVARAVRKVQHSKSSEVVITQLFEYIKSVEHESEAIRLLFRELLKRVSQPWLNEANGWVGLQSSIDQQSHRPSFVKEISDETALPEQAKMEVEYEPSLLPSFVSDEIGQQLFETGRSLAILRKHSPTHPLCSRGSIPSTGDPFQLSFGWEDIERISSDAAEYENNLAEAVMKYKWSGNSDDDIHRTEMSSTVASEAAVSSSVEVEPHTWELFADQIDLSVRKFDAIDEPKTDDLDNVVCRLLGTCGTKPSNAFDPELYLAPSLSISPLLSVQTKLVNASILRLLFRPHRLRAHLSLQNHFHLLGNGTFTTRLTSALFDPSRATAERQKGVMRTHEAMGLRLGERTAWPPASSELQLALMGIMGECYKESNLPTLFSTTSEPKPAQSPIERTEIPGTLNFAIRQLSSADADKCMDPSSLYALDFLRLQYVAPSPINSIITLSSLAQYDAIFKALLRLQRMLFVVSHLPRQGLGSSARRFRLEAQNFMSVCSSYFFDTGVTESWAGFMAYVNRLEKDLAREDEAGTLGKLVSEGVESLRAAHERCLDRIMFALLLRKRQAKVMALLEEVFGIVLEFAKACSSADVGNDGVLRLNEREVGRLRETFRSKITVFINVCRGLVGKKGYGTVASLKVRGANATGEENTIERLLLALEMNSYYESRP